MNNVFKKKTPKKEEGSFMSIFTGLWQDRWYSDSQFGQSEFSIRTVRIFNK